MNSTVPGQWRIYHNPRCSKSRTALKFLQDKGVEPEVVRYMDCPLGSEELQCLTALLDVSASDLIRRGESLFDEVCGKDDISESEAIDLMVKHPRLMQRPIVVNGDRGVIGRPPENLEQLF